MHWLEDTVWLHKLIRHKDGSIVSISNISELEWSDMSNCSSLMRVKLAVIQRQFQMKECDILTVVRQNILWPFLHTFRGVRSSPPPGSTPLVSHPSCRRSFVGRTACEPWWWLSTAGHLHPRFGILSWATITLSPVEQKRHWLEDTHCLLRADQT